MRALSVLWRDASARATVTATHGNTLFDNSGSLVLETPLESLSSANMNSKVNLEQNNDVTVTTDVTINDVNKMDVIVEYRVTMTSLMTSLQMSSTHQLLHNMAAKIETDWSGDDVTGSIRFELSAREIYELMTQGRCDEITSESKLDWRSSFPPLERAVLDVTHDTIKRHAKRWSRRARVVSRWTNYSRLHRKWRRIRA